MYESHVCQQRVCQCRIAVHAFWRMLCAKPIPRLHEMHNLRLHIHEELDTFNYELRIHVKPCNKNLTKRRDLPLLLGAVYENIHMSFHMRCSRQPLSNSPS